MRGPGSARALRPYAPVLLSRGVTGTSVQRGRRRLVGLHEHAFTVTPMRWSSGVKQYGASVRIALAPPGCARLAVGPRYRGHHTGCSSKARMRGIVRKRPTACFGSCGRRACLFIQGSSLTLKCGPGSRQRQAYCHYCQVGQQYCITSGAALPNSVPSPGPTPPHECTVRSHNAALASCHASSPQTRVNHMPHLIITVSHRMLCLPPCMAYAPP